MLPQEQRRQQRQEYFHNVSPVFMTKSRTASVSFSLVVEIQALENQNQKSTPIQKLRFKILNQKKLSVLFSLFLCTKWSLFCFVCYVSVTKQIMCILEIVHIFSFSYKTHDL